MIPALPPDLAFQELGERVPQMHMPDGDEGRRTDNSIRSFRHRTPIHRALPRNHATNIRAVIALPQPLHAPDRIEFILFERRAPAEKQHTVDAVILVRDWKDKQMAVIHPFPSVFFAAEPRRYLVRIVPHPLSVSAHQPAP